jgi:hypothetical protein
VSDAVTKPAVGEAQDSVVIHGIRDADRARSLIYSLAEIPCYPSVIFRIDRYGRLIGAIDQLRSPARIYYVKVLNWNHRSGKRPVIAWTLRPQDLSTRLAANMRRALGLYSSKLRGRPPMTVKVSLAEHAALHAKMGVVAS